MSNLEYTTLGRTGLRVSVMGLGCGGHSRLGLSQGHSEAEAEGVVKGALDLGVNFIDTAEGYRNEEVVGRAIKGVTRDQVVISTKVGIGWQDRRSTAQEMRDRVHACLTRLDTDYVDIFHLHGVTQDEYEYGVSELVPVLQDLKAEGKVRSIGITEAFIRDPAHATLRRAVHDDCWDVMMIGFSILNQSARETLLPLTREKGIGTLCMFAVRRALSRPEALRELLQSLIDTGAIHGVEAETALDFVTAAGAAGSLQEAAYRFCRWEPGIDVVLSGTGNLDHLRANAEALSLPPLPDTVAASLREIFAGVDSVSGN